MPFIDMPIGDAVEREVLPEDTYDLRIEKAEPMESKDKPGQTNIRVLLKAPEYPNSKSIFHYIAGFGPTDDAEKRNNKLLQLKAFLETFNIPFSAEGFELEDMLGQEGRCKVTQEEYEGETRNKLVIAWG